MFSIEYKDAHCLEIKNTLNTNCAKINLTHGGQLSALTINECTILEDLKPLHYKQTYASSILFPFANRIQDGTYSFNNTLYEFSINEPNQNNAIHGLVYDKTFKVLQTKATEDFALVKLIYNAINKPNGFPYAYAITLQYTFYKMHTALQVTVTNTDTKTFPFTLGWHPYFISKNLNVSTLQFDSSKKVVFDDRMITKKIENVETTSVKIENQQLDDCWFLNDTKVNFITPDYTLELTSSEADSFLQVYTPPRKNTIAIEPTTGISNSFNNNIGLKTLKPSDSYQITWSLKLHKP